MKHDLTGKKIAILATDGFEQVELEKPRRALANAGAETALVAPHGGQVQGWNHQDKGDKFKVDAKVDAARASDYDGLLLPGGVMNPDALRQVPAAVRFVRAFCPARKPVAAICHGPQMLIEAGVGRGRRLTSFPSLRTDLKNAGATGVNAAVVSDRGLVTSRQPDDIPRFNAKLIQKYAEGGPAGRKNGRRG
jgi:protease I